MNIFFYLALFVASLSAEKLLFQEGQQAHYTISQSVDVKADLGSVKFSRWMDSRLSFDLELIKVPEGEADFPFVVALSIKEMAFELRSEDCDNNDVLELFENCRNGLIGKRLEFQVNGPFAVEELSGALKELPYTWFDDNFTCGDHFFELFFTQLFDRGHPTDLTIMLSYDSPIVGGTPAAIEWNAEKMNSNWEMTLYVAKDLEVGLSVKEAVKLAVESSTLTNYPLVQQRSCNFSHEIFGIITNITQRWESF